MNETSDRRGNNILWALVLIAAGFIFLLNNFGLLSVDVWAVLVRFWPVILIIWGLRMILAKSRLGKTLINILATILLVEIIILAAAAVNHQFRTYLQSQFPFIPRVVFELLRP